jgi:eukaryotic-like serine/threonine-protein kinase
VSDPSSIPESIGRYRIVRQIGRGGMGIVFEGIDDQLERQVAIKTILPASDPAMRERFLREARAAAAVNHPHICQLFEIGEHAGEPFLAMEFLEGRSLGDRLAEGPLPAPEAVSTTLGILSALEALHHRGIIHRDLKPSNVFMTPHGVKLLDFGLARPVSVSIDTTSLTMPGVLMGTPRYMAPEQASGGEVDSRSDLFAVGAVLFEMLSGRPAFTGDSVIDILHAVLHDHPPALVGSPAVAETDRVIQRALAKLPVDRYQSAETMAMDLRACLTRADLATSPVARAATRLIVLPFRVLRPDPAIDFLAYSLPDAITVSLSGIESLIVRSSLTASAFAQGTLDLRRLATDAGVDAVVTGTLLQAGDLVRVSVQLVDVPAGTVLWSHTAQVRLDDLFQVQDSVSSAVVEALALPLSSREQRMMRRDVPASAEAYGFYLRANRLSAYSAQWGQARDFYRRAVEADPSYAPAWARLGRCLRVMGKYGMGDAAHQFLSEADDAFSRAFRINPDLSLAHNLYTHVEVDSGRAEQAVVRLLGRIRDRTSDPELYAGLVHACRYCGLLEASIAAYNRASRLDPSIRTSVAHSFFMNGDCERAIETDREDPPYVTTMALLSLGRTDDVIKLCRTEASKAPGNQHLTAVLSACQAIVEGDYEGGQRAVTTLLEFSGFSDPEGWYYWALASVGLRDYDRALTLLRRAVDTGWHCGRALETAVILDPIRREPAFTAIVERARAAHAAAARAFAEADGHRILGLPTPS